MTLGAGGKVEVIAKQGKKVELKKKEGGQGGVFRELAIGPGQEVKEILILIMLGRPV